MKRFTLISACVLYFLLIQGWPDGSCFGATLYEKSLAQFQAKAQKASPKEYAFVVLGDSRGNEAVFRKALAKAASFDPLFVLHGGDYSETGGAKETDRFLTVIKQSLPTTALFVVRGNHEKGGIFQERIGPGTFSIYDKRLGLNLVVLDNAEYKLGRTQLEYLQTALAKPSASTFVAMHVPPKTARWSWHTFTDGAEEFKAVVAKGGVDGLFFSHVHLFDRVEYAGVPAFITGGAGAPLVRFGFPGEPVYHILVVKVKQGKVSYQMVPLSQ